MLGYWRSVIRLFVAGLSMDLNSVPVVTVGVPTSRFILNYQEVGYGSRFITDL
jgi:hypothetical protein